CVEIAVPESAPVDARSCSISVAIAPKSAVASGWKTIAATPCVVIRCAVSSVTYAVDIANSRSAAGALSFLRPPRIASKSPMPRSLRGGERAGLQLALVLHELLDALLHRRVRREQPGDDLLRRGDVERAQLVGDAQVALRQLVHPRRDLA